MIITITGKAGSGKSTLAKSLAKRLKYKYYSIGELQRKFANSKGLTLEELRELESKDHSIDNEFDDYQKKLGETEKKFIMDSRFGALFLKDVAYKIFIDCSDDERYKRIITDTTSNRSAELKTKITKADILKRDNEDRKRSKVLYNFDYFDSSNYDLVIDSTNMTPDEVVEFALNKILKC